MKGLMLHCGGQLAPREQVFAVAPPVPTRTYVPLAYESFITRIEKQLAVEGIRVKGEELALAKDGQRLFGLMELEFNDLPSREYGCVLGLRNSYDKSFSTGVVVGANCFVCDNLSFSGDISFERKHTANLLKDLSWLLTETVSQLPARFAAQSATFERYRRLELTDRQAHDLIIKLYDSHAVNITEVPRVLKEWREPSHPEFAESRNAWRLFNATTETIKGDLWRLPARTSALHRVLDIECGVVRDEGSAPTVAEPISEEVAMN